MIAEKLRYSVLLAAIQGKLTKQLPEDNDIYSLISKIQMEKSFLVKKGILSKLRRINDIIEDEIPFDIPEHWKWVRLEFVSYNIGRRENQIQQSEILSEGIFPVVSQSSKLVEGFYNDKSKLLKIAPQSVIVFGDHSKTLKLVNFDFIIGADGTKIIVPIVINPVYLFYVLSFNIFFMRDRGYSRHYQFLNEKLIPLPPLEEQNRIVEKLNSILIEVDKLKYEEIKLNQLQKIFPQKMKDSIVQHAIQGKLTRQNLEDGDALDLISEIKGIKAQMVLEGRIKKEKALLDISENEMPFDIPKSWAWVRLGDLSVQITDGTHKTPQYVNSGIPFLTIQNISSGEFNLSKLKYISPTEHSNISKRCKPELGDILFCRIGTLGKPIINTLDFEFSIFVSLALIKLVNNDLNEYLVYYLSSPAMNKWIDENKVGGGTHTNKINLRDLINVPIPLPPLSEQIRIVEYLREILPICENIEKNYNRLN